MRAEVTHDGGLGKGAGITLFVGGSQATDGHIERTHGIMFSADETANVGFDAGSQV